MSDHDETRRRFVRDSLVVGAALGGVLQSGAAWSQSRPMSDPHPALERPLTRIAFGSCAKQSKDQPIWDTVLASRPDLFVFLGDNIYGDTRDMGELRAKYAQLAAKPGFQKLRATTPIVAIWDDHDYGEDDAGADYPMKEQSRQIFLDFWQEHAASPRRSRNGIYASYLFGPEDRRVQVIMPDLRFNRTPIARQDLGGQSYKEWEQAKRKAGGEVPGPYARLPDHEATMLGEQQWRWLEQQFDVPAQLRIFASSLQVLADFPGWEAWINYARDHQRLIELIRRKRAGGVIFISGDTHYAELTRLDVNVPYPFWELTSSGLTEVWPVNVPNANRVGEQLREPNFGLIEIDWSAAPVGVTLKALDLNGVARIEQRLSLDKLQARS
ncbi:alkaline phosphatase family protein [Steroidobacter sp. S1-65]|uniref:Alkaline phosphatase family protein n=1 Tax=Steroidobacter gossypii TaxID=2805490 RepID=A0ABS1X3H4_9GAMM|nr:alkaline phosphatase D family protein [Steroidobacter gossypii]MBM0107742.1 alkaline phosphatase family protein [Steroidobacter gossypii]